MIGLFVWSIVCVRARYFLVHVGTACVRRADVVRYYCVASSRTTVHCHCLWQGGTHSCQGSSVDTVASPPHPPLLYPCATAFVYFVERGPL